MFLKSLTLSSGHKIIRRVEFHEGLNLIVDETPSGSDQKTGNNVGKTTILALVDFCLGASGKSVYTDPENRKDEHKLVKSFLIESEVLVTLVLTADLADDESEELVIERNFVPRRGCVRKIDGENLTEDEFERRLTERFFPGHFGKKPTFRQIISHNVRYKDLSINNTLKTLDGFTRDEEYETLYLFLFGCNVEHGERKQELLTKLRVERSFKDRLEKENTRSAYESALAILDGEIEKLVRRKANFNLNEKLEGELDTLNGLRYRISVVGAELSRLDLRRNLILEAEKDLSSGSIQIDRGQLRAIYNQAREGMEGIQKTFEELCEFHERMMREKVAFITQELPGLESRIREKSTELKSLRAQEREIAGNITQSDSFDELERVIAELNEKYRKKGEYEKTISQIKETETNLQSLNRDLEGIDDVLFSDESADKLREQLGKFNKFFADISSELYGEQYALKVDQVVNRKGQRLYKFSAFNTNFSSGKKQGEIFCFDIAYTLFADEEGIPCLHFLLNDKKELVHGNQLVNIARLVEEKKIQFVASMLRDKLPPELDDEKYFAVRLSQTDKALRVERTLGMQG